MSHSTPIPTSHVDDVCTELLNHGYVRVRLEPREAAALQAALQACRDFFRLPFESKLRHSSPDLNFGYRPLGHEYSATPERPDLNEAFTLWSDRLDLIPAADEQESLTAALTGYRDVLTPVIEKVLAHLAASFGGATPSFRAASYLQINSYAVSDTDRDLLQDRHEDGHMLTALHAAAPGLELWPLGNGPVPVTTAQDEIIIMPGSILTELTGGRVEPLDHQVRNLEASGRMSLMYFVNPNLDRPLYSWADRQGDVTDLRDKVAAQPSAFGLPHVPQL